ncbi:MAG: lipase family protein [Lautropia sp.]
MSDWQGGAATAQGSRVPTAPSALAFARGARRRTRLAIGLVTVSLFVAACGNDDPPARGTLIDSTSTGQFSVQAIDAATTASGVQVLSGPARCDVDVRRVGYYTPGPKGEEDVKVVAAMLVPSGAGCPGPYPLVAYDRGTDVLASRDLSNPTDGETQLLIAMLAGQGYVVVTPNYLGYAGSTWPDHPYLHADSEASTTIDAIRAARSALADSGVALNGRVMLAGYSQGGHASMATQRVIERDLRTEFNVVASGHMSGPYNLTGSFVDGLALLPTGSAGSTIFSPFAITSFQKVYGDLYADPAEYFKAPYASGIGSLLPGPLTSTELITSGRLPPLLGDLITDKLQADLANPASRLRAALDANSLIAWTPATPMLLCGGSRDPVVAFKNAQDAQAAFAARGVSVVTIDVETVPEFAAQFPAQLGPAQLSAYHGTTVPPLCMKVVRDSLFSLVKG